MGARLHRAAQQERAVQEGRRPAQRAGPHPLHLLPPGLRLDRPGRPAWSLPLDGPLHAARTGLRRRQDRPARGGGARRPLLHDARAHRRRDPRRCRPPGAGRGLDGVRPQHRRHHRPQQHPVPLDRDRERPGDLGAPRGGRPHAPRGVRRQPAPLPRLPRRRHRQGRDHRRLRGARRDQAPQPRQPGVLQPAAQVQDRADRPPEPRRRARGQRRGVRRHRPPRARPRLRPLGRRRPVHQPDARPQARRLDPARRGGRRLGGRRRHLPRLRLPPPALQGPPEVPARRLGQGEVPRGPGERVPPPRARRQPLPRGAGRPGRPHRHPRAAGRHASTSAPPPSWAASTAPR